MPSISSVTKAPFTQHTFRLPRQLSSTVLRRFSTRPLRQGRPPCSSGHQISTGAARFAFTSTSHPPPASSQQKPPRRPSLQTKLTRSPQPNYNKSFTPLETQQANLVNWTTALIIGIVGGVLFALSSASTVRQSQQDQTSTTDSATYSSANISPTTTTDKEEENWDAKMTGEEQPGRPGTLTSEQEEKLRLFWIAASKVFGIIDDKFIEDLNGDALASPDAEDKPEKKKKSRLGFLKRKDKNDGGDADSSTSSESEHKRGTSVSDDKYGQTKQFHDTLAQQKPEDLRRTMWYMVKHDHPDALLLRFLRARKWDVDKALIMMVSTMNWRAQDMHIDDDVILNGDEGALKDANTNDEEAKKKGSGEDFMAQLRMGKSYLHGADKTGRPMCFVNVRLHKQGEQSEASLERCTVYTIETARMMLSPPVDTACVVFDMNGFSLANMDYAPVKFMIKCFEANYPESLGVVLVHKAPWVFQGVWKIIKGWLDPVVASKVHFTNSLDDLSTYIDTNHIPTSLGGEEDWTYKYIEPIPGENDRMKDVATKERLEKEREAVVRRYEEATKEWIVMAEKGRGTKEVRGRRNGIAEELRVGYWKLDPYIRARTVYDRTGVLGEGGKVDFWPKDKGMKELTNGVAKVSVNGNGGGVQTSEADLD